MKWLRCGFAFTEREYLLSGVNDLTSSLKISDTTKREFFELSFLESDQCSGLFNVLTVHKCSDRELFRQLSNRAF